MKHSSFSRACVATCAVLVSCAVAAVSAAQGGAPAPAKPASPAKTEPSAIRLGSKEAKPKTPGTIRIATYNVENLFDHKDDPALTGSIEDMDLAATPERCEAIAKAILATQADIIAVEEVESLEALTWFRDTYLKGAGYEFVASIQSGDPRGIEQAILSKIPFQSAALAIPLDQLKLDGVHPSTLPKSDANKIGKPIVFSRSPLRVEFVIPAEKVATLITESETAKIQAANAAKSKDKSAKPLTKGEASKVARLAAAAKDYSFTLLVLHHKSGRDYAHQRQAEAKKVLSVVQALEAERPMVNVLLAGDFNSLPQHEGPQVYFTGGLIDLFADRQRGDTTMLTHATNRAIDYLVVNKNMQAEVVMESRFILGTPLRPANSDWNKTPAPTGYASDHLPVVVDFRPTE